MTELDDVRAQIAELAGQLGDGEAQAAHAAEMERLEAELAAPAVAVERVLGAVEDLRAITVPAAMLASAPEVLVRGSDLDRVVLSVVSDGVMTAEAVHVRGDEAGGQRLLDALREHPVRLEHPLVETEALRRRRATLVADTADARVDRPTAAVMDWPAYVVAPVAVRSAVVAVLQADRPGAELGPRDAATLWTFAAGLAQLYESATLRRTLRHERRQMRRLLTWLDARSGELADATIAFVPRTGEVSALPQPDELDGAVRRPERDRDGSPVLDAVLTRRELEILRLLADGLTNRAIAAELVISGGTVKFHVNSILRKLHVANRAEAVARYYALLDARRG
jgi:DNA-binding CsgD family transcriptional regulator